MFTKMHVFTLLGGFILAQKREDSRSQPKNTPFLPEIIEHMQIWSES